jgi:hypothetical protein
MFQLRNATKQDNFTNFHSKLVLRKYTELQLLLFLILHISALDTVVYSEITVSLATLSVVSS